jgi:signal peptidase
VRKIGHIVSIALAVVLFATCLGILAVRMLGMASFVVTGSSMEPTIQKGALVIVEPVLPTAVGRGDVITFEHYGQMTTHRVIAIDASNATSPSFTTKGDANTVADPEPIRFTGQVGVYRASIPLLGYAIVYAQAYWRLALTALAALTFLLCGAMLVFGNAKAMRPRTRRRQAAPATATGNDPDELWASHMGWLRESTARRIAA